MITRLLIATSLAATLFLSACNAPLSPGYQIEKKEIEVRFLSSPAQTLHIRATYHLKNSGNAPLDFLDAELPSSLGRQNLLISLDGQPVSPTLTAETARIAFPSSWPVKSSCSLLIEYDLAPPDQLTQDSFYLHPNNWYPALLPPKNLLSRADPPDQWDLRIRVPDGFLVHASGTPRGSSRSGSERVFRFTQRPGDFRPFIVSGRYLQQQVRSNGVTVNFWSFQPLPADKVQRAATRLVSTVQIFESIFGPATKGRFSIWIAEAVFPGSPTPDIAEPFTAGVFLSGLYFQEEFGTPEFFEIAESLLASIWTSEVVPHGRHLDDLAIVLEDYAAQIAAEAHGVRIDRAREISERIDTYDQLTKSEAERDPSSGGDAWRAAMRRTEKILFVCALEDRLGREVLNRGLRRMIQARRDLDWSIDDLRSALELESGQNLAEFFRVWLYQPGIPDDFRRRYAQP